MVFAVTYRTKSDLSGINKLKDLFKYINSKSVYCGVLNVDANTAQAAYTNDQGGLSVYSRGPYKGEPVQVPPRPFVSGPTQINRMAKQIVNAGASVLKDGITKGKIDIGLERMGKTATNLQREAIEFYSSTTHNSPKTIETKHGLDKPLYTERGATFPISYEIGKRGK